MQKRLFGTDGIRGTVNQYPMTAEVAMKFGMAAGMYLRRKGDNNRVVVAKDTRLSGYLIEPALTSGLISVGVDVTLVGPMPTPAVPMLIKSLRADFGVMISASHNPYYDNGLKLFDRYGDKLGEACENKLQDLILGNELEQHLAAPDKLGRANRLEDAPGRYIEYIKNSFPKNKTLSGLRIVIDCANGGAYRLAPTILWELGAEVISIGCEPNGFNINESCGSTHPSVLIQKVLEVRADIGIALDGDADRIIICDETGNIVAGDYLIAIIAKYLQSKALLRSDAVIITQMSNSALDIFLENNGIKVYRTKIGDRYVAEAMKKYQCNFGGEQSGHLIYSDYATTGDGILIGLQVLALLVEAKKKLSSLVHMFDLNPQVLSNVRFSYDNPLENKQLDVELESIKEKYKDMRILVRKSGTEKLIRIMVEGNDIKAINIVMREIEKTICRYIV